MCCLPNVVTSWLGLFASESSSSQVTIIVTAIIKKVVAEGYTLVSDYKTFANFLKGIALDLATSSLSTSDLVTLESLINSGDTCGTQVQDVINQVVNQVMVLKTASVSVSTAQIRSNMSESDLFLADIPVITTAFMANDSITSYSELDQVRKALLLIID